MISSNSVSVRSRSNTVCLPKLVYNRPRLIFSDIDSKYTHVIRIDVDTIGTKSGIPILDNTFSYCDLLVTPLEYNTHKSYKCEVLYVHEWIVNENVHRDSRCICHSTVSCYFEDKELRDNTLHSIDDIRSIVDNNKGILYRVYVSNIVIPYYTTLEPYIGTNPYTDLNSTYISVPYYSFVIPIYSTNLADIEEIESKLLKHKHFIVSPLDKVKVLPISVNQYLSIFLGKQ